MPRLYPPLRACTTQATGWGALLTGTQSVVGGRSSSAEKQAARLERRKAALALRPSMSPAGPAPDHLRVATWNLNSLRARLPALERFLERTRPDIVCLQETKAPSVSETAAALFDRLGFKPVHVGSSAYNGVAVLARHPIEEARSSGEFDDEVLDREPRVASCLVHTPDASIRVASVYVPHGRIVGHWHYDYKLAFLDALAARTRKWVADDPHVVVAGDFNVAATNSDVFHPDAFVGSTHVTGPERDALTACSTAGSSIRLDTTWIDHTERGMDRPSDHAALLADFRSAS